MRARASAYGEPFAYRPEDRAVMAVDGDPATAWRVGDRSDPIGERLVLDVDEPIDHLTLQQPIGAAGRAPHRPGDHHGRRPAAAHRRPRRVVVRAAGQRVDIEPTTGPSTVTITIDGVVVPDPTIGPALAAVGFAEVGTGLGPTVEVVRPPADAADAIAAAGSDVPVSFVLTRLRTRPTDRWRADPEPALVRDIELPDERSFDLGRHGPSRPAGRRRRARRAARHRRPARRSSPDRCGRRRRLGRGRRRSGDVVDHPVRRGRRIVDRRRGRRAARPRSR